MVDNAELMIEIKDLDITFKMATGDVHAIRGVDFCLRKNEVLALVGESGCGKSITVKTIMGILPENAVINSGEVIYHENGKETDLLKKHFSWRQKNINGSNISMVFQDPMTSLNPTMTIGAQLITAIRDHEKVGKMESYARSVELLQEVGITDPERTMEQYPHQLSGGMRQRIVIAIALSCNPRILICDEPTTALDVTIQNRILDLIQNIQRSRGISVIFITHNLGVVTKIADYVGVMYAGKIVEYGTVFDIFYDPRHPYTWGLLSAIPEGSDDKSDLYSIPGTPPNLAEEIKGDAFAPRNPYAMTVDFKAEAPAFKISDTHYAATWLLDDRAPKTEMPAALRERIERMKQEGRDYVKNEE
ncbi:MAG: ABC transporter ATP-binding protein [Lachnospiraceae bacterium]|nr:ABC transporter ATP-binding protein [Lachnospiraceae bacterium]